MPQGWRFLTGFLACLTTYPAIYFNIPHPALTLSSIPHSAKPILDPPRNTCETLCMQTLIKQFKVLYLPCKKARKLLKNSVILSKFCIYTCHSVIFQGFLKRKLKLCGSTQLTNSFTRVSEFNSFKKTLFKNMFYKK